MDKIIITLDFSFSELLSRNWKWRDLTLVVNQCFSDRLMLPEILN
jgi:hypothetical protein